MASVLYPLCAILAWLAAFYKLAAMRRQKDAPLLVLCAAFFLLAVIFTISVPVIWRQIDWMAGYPNISALLSQGCVISFTATLQALLLLWLNSREGAWARIRSRSPAFAAVLGAMVALFLMTPTGPENSTDFAVSNAGQPYYGAYLMLFVTAFAVMQVEVIRLCARYARNCGRPWLRRGLHTAMAGAAFGLVYCLARAADVAGAASGLDPRSWEPVAELGAGGGEILYLIGWTMPSWGLALSAASSWVADYLSHRQLYALWAVLYELAPGIALDPPKSWASDVLNLRDLDFRLHRRVIEIQDGCLALRPHLAAAAADGPAAADAPLVTADPPSRTDPVLAATQIRAAIDARVGNAPPPTAAAFMLAPGEQGDHDGEMKWLVAVGRAFRRSAPATAG